VWLLEQITGMVAAHYKDKTKAGIVISKLDDGFYASIARYSTPFKKVLVCSTRGHKTLEGAIIAVAVEWCEKTKLPMPTRPAPRAEDRFAVIEIT
jgi:hypothetical protein